MSEYWMTINFCNQLNVTWNKSAYIIDHLKNENQIMNYLSGNEIVEIKYLQIESKERNNEKT